MEKTIRTVAQIGLGAVGAFPAGRLRDTLGEGYTVIAGGKRRERLSKGVVINGQREFFPLTAPEDGKPVDLVLFTVKNPQLPQAMGDAQNFIGEGTVLLSLLNGIDSEERLKARFPQAHVLRAYIKVPATNENGVITLPLDKGKIFFGEDRNDTLSSQTAAVEDLFRRAGIPCEVPTDMVRSQWYKYMSNVSENQLAAVLGLCYRDFQHSVHVRQLRRMVCAEVVEVAQACGVDLRAEDIMEQETYLDSLRPEGKPSTLQDLEAGRLTEVATFSGRMMELARQHEIEVPLCTMLYHAIRFLEERQHPELTLP